MMFFGSIGSLFVLLTLSVAFPNAEKNILLRRTRSSCKMEVGRLIAALFHVSHLYDKQIFYLSREGIESNIYAARSMCLRIGGYMAEIKTNSELKFVTNFVKEHAHSATGVFIGGTDEEKEGTFVYYRNGEPMNYAAWHHNDPNNYLNKEDCVSLWPLFQWKMVDDDCNQSHGRRFLCEVPQD